jgi:uncharacterized integral membrane protein
VSTPDPRPVNPPGTDPTLGMPGTTHSGPPTVAAGGVPTVPTAPGPTAPGPAAPGPAAPAQPRTGHTGRTIGRTLAAALLIFVTVVLVLFVVFNTQTVDISLVFADVEAPLVLALVIAAVLGGLVVALLGAMRRARRRNR